MISVSAFDIETFAEVWDRVSPEALTKNAFISLVPGLREEVWILNVCLREDDAFMEMGSSVWVLADSIIECR
jgi:hypothetical protein